MNRVLSLWWTVGPRRLLGGVFVLAAVACAWAADPAPAPAAATHPATVPGVPPGVLIAYEGFDYKDGAALGGQNGGTGWNGAWYGSKSDPGVAIKAPGVTFPKLAVTGLMSVQDGKDTRLFRKLDTARPQVAALVEDGQSGKTFGKDGTTVWVGFLIACRSYPKVAHGGIHLMDGVELEGNYKATQRIQMGRQNISKFWYLGRVDQGGPAAGKWEGTVEADATVRLLVYRFDFKAGPEEGWMWVDPAPAPAPGYEPDPAKADLHAPKIADFRFNAVNIGSGGGAIYAFDELRIGTTFAAVAPLGSKGPREPGTEGPMEGPSAPRP